jgi:hypothetical protein
MTGSRAPRHGSSTGTSAELDEEVAVKTSQHGRTGLKLRSDTHQQGSPPIQPRSQQRVQNVSIVIAMALWLELKNRLRRLPARYVGLRRRPMG